MMELRLSRYNGTTGPTAPYPTITTCAPAVPTPCVCSARMTELHPSRYDDTTGTAVLNLIILLALFTLFWLNIADLLEVCTWTLARTWCIRMDPCLHARGVWAGTVPCMRCVRTYTCMHACLYVCMYPFMCVVCSCMLGCGKHIYF